MEKDILIQNLKTKAGIDNLSDRTYDEVATVLLPQFADDEKITEETWNLPIQMLKSMSGQLRHEVADGITKGKAQWETEQKTTRQKAIDDAIATFKTQWEKDHPTTTEDPKDKKDADIDQKIADAIAKATAGLTSEEGVIGKLSKQFSEYLTQQAARENAATEASMRQQILEYVMDFDGLDEDDSIVENVMLKLQVKSDKKLDDLKNEAKALYEKAYGNFVAKHGGGKPFGGSSSGGSGGSVSEIEKWKKSRQDAIDSEAEAAAELEKQIFK